MFPLSLVYSLYSEYILFPNYCALHKMLYNYLVLRQGSASTNSIYRCLRSAHAWSDYVMISCAGSNSISENNDTMKFRSKFSFFLSIMNETYLRMKILAFPSSLSMQLRKRFLYDCEQNVIFIISTSTSKQMGYWCETKDSRLLAYINMRRICKHLFYTRYTTEWCDAMMYRKKWFKAENFIFFAKMSETFQLGRFLSFVLRSITTHTQRNDRNRTSHALIYFETSDTRAILYCTVIVWYL